MYITFLPQKKKHLKGYYIYANDKFLSYWRLEGKEYIQRLYIHVDIFLKFSTSIIRILWHTVILYRNLLWLSNFNSGCQTFNLSSGIVVVLTIVYLLYKDNISSCLSNWGHHTTVYFFWPVQNIHSNDKKKEAILLRIFEIRVIYKCI